jgi:hypothetical protein
MIISIFAAIGVMTIVLMMSYQFTGAGLWFVDKNK